MKKDTYNYKKYFEKFRNKKVMVIGDIMLDSYVWGSVERISPEAPIPIVHVEKTSQNLGGCGNVALNIKSLGATPLVYAVTGKDAASADILNIMVGKDISAEGIILDESRKTTVKERVFAHHQQVVRIDSETKHSLNKATNKKLLASIADGLEIADALIIEDYDKGVLHKENIREIIKMANRQKTPIYVDPKINNFSSYSNIHLFKPNFKELKEGTKSDFTNQDLEQINEVIKTFQRKRKIDTVLLTLSEMGMYYLGAKDTFLIPAQTRDVSDVSGAGDTVISVFTLCEICGMSNKRAVSVANIAGGIVCEKSGVAPVTVSELLLKLNSFS